MPLSINVGLSRKASRNYQSSGTSINIVAELDQSLLARPDELQSQIDDLYQQAADAIDRNAASPLPTPPRERERYDRGAQGSGNGNAARNADRGHDRSGGITDNQRRAIHAMARRINVDPALEARDIVGAEFDALSVRQASELIDHLKSLMPAGNGR